jgi:23S rRNA A2030 N6-methylase RlmJ
VDWKVLDDPVNKQNRNAGNGGDLVKHTVYLATLRFLLAREPWNKGLRLRECHAGRGLYRIPDDHARHRLLSCLNSDPATGDAILLHSAQRTISATLARWPNAPEAAEWYAGSALLNAFALARDHEALHEMELYELQPETRRILRMVLSNAHLRQPSLCILPALEQDGEFDGEAHIERRIGEWDKRDLVLLDPFAIWRQPADQSNRDRYGAIVDGLLSHGTEAPSLILCWTWGNAFPVADADLRGTAKPVRNGYQELREKIHKSGFHFLVITWRWGLQFAMWVVAPQGHLAALRDDIGKHCRRLSDHLIRHGCGHSLSHPTVEVVID